VTLRAFAPAGARKVIRRRTCCRDGGSSSRRYLNGWRGYFGFCETPSVLRALDDWIRRRLRAIAWKQWKRGRTRFAELRKRGVELNLAAQTAGSPHRPWRLSKSPALNLALSKTVLSDLGLASLAPATTV